jgi:hypothetical protein
VVEDLMGTIQEQVKSYKKNIHSTRKLLQKHLAMPLYYVITNGGATKFPLTWSSIQTGNVHNNFLTFLEKRNNKTQKEEPSDDDLMDTSLVVQWRFYLPHGKREAIEKKSRMTQHQSKTLLSHNPAYQEVVEQLAPVGFRNTRLMSWKTTVCLQALNHTCFRSKKKETEKRSNIRGTSRDLIFGWLQHCGSWQTGTK